MLILGAGPAGLACGIMAAWCGEKVEVLEKNNRPGIKLLLSGAGQCNLTHGGAIDDFLNHYGGIEKSRFVKPCLFTFSNTDTMQFFEQRGVPLFERENGKIFPRSLQSGDILQALLKELEINGGKLHTGIDINSVRHTEEGFFVETNQGLFSSKRLAIAAGGMSFPKTGSTGEGYRWAEQFGHRIIPPKPALAPVIIERYPFTDAAGISLDDVLIDVSREGKRIRQGCGDILFTHHGLSGPGILDLSRFLEPQDVLKVQFCRCTEELRPLLVGKKMLKNALAPLGIPERLLQGILNESGIFPETPVSEIDRDTRHRLRSALAGFPFTIREIGSFTEAMATSGGVALDGVNRRTMESRLVPSLFFCGEVLDIDGDTGGYNIQFALSSGFLAGKQQAPQKEQHSPLII